MECWNVHKTFICILYKNNYGSLVMLQKAALSLRVNQLKNLIDPFKVHKWTNDLYKK
jgi:hypothetical protein